MSGESGCRFEHGERGVGLGEGESSRKWAEQLIFIVTTVLLKTE